MVPTSRLLSFAGSDHGSSLVEFTVLMPLLLSVLSIGFSQIFETQLREQAVTAFARSIARAVELGSTQAEVVEFANVLQADARFEHPPGLRFACIEDAQTCSVTAEYRGSIHTSLIDRGDIHVSLRAQFETGGSGSIR
ncbi:MAG: hypothetical protein RIR46_1289 [Actinomycetota bacterium]|jgi:hypothetical protein